MSKNIITINKTKYLIMGWHQDFECPGGDCGLTCCSYEWNISLTDEEIKHYEELDNPYRDTILQAIDREKKTLKCSNGKCDLLNEEGYCNIVLNCGVEHLSNTCTVFPRAHKKYGDIVEVFVEIVCPLVAKYLLENHVIDFVLHETDEVMEVNIDEIPLYDTLCIARTKLVELMQTLPGQFTTGKAFILFSICNKIRNLIKENKLNNENVTNELNHYFSDEALSTIFFQCESFKDNLLAKTSLIQQILTNLNKNDLLSRIINYSIVRFPFILNYFQKWINNREALEADLLQYINYLRNNHPTFTENYFVYVLFTSWCSQNQDSFGNEILIRVIEQMITHLAAMAYYLENKELPINNFSVIISMIDRRMAHSKKLFQSILDAFQENSKETPLDITSIMLILII